MKLEKVRLKTPRVPTLKGLRSIYQVGPVQWAVGTSVGQGHEDRVLQLLLQLLRIFLGSLLARQIS